MTRDEMLAEWISNHKSLQAQNFIKVSCVYLESKKLDYSTGLPVIDYDEDPSGYRLDCYPKQIFSSIDELMIWLQVNYSGVEDFGGIVLDMNDIQATKFINAWKIAGDCFHVETKKEIA
jgi:hypothetical protein